MKSTFAYLLTLAMGSTAFASAFYSSTDPLSQAHAAFVAGDSLKVVTSIRDSLMENPFDQRIKKNALSLYKQTALKAGTKGLPADWTLPEEILRMKVTVRRVQSDRLIYQLKIGGEVKNFGLIEQLQVIRYPDQVVLDKLNNVGNFSEEKSVSGGVEYQIQSAKSVQPIPTGLYLLRLKLASGAITDGWFLVDEDMNATAAPEILSPSFGQVVTTDTPTIRWKDYHSPEYKPSEQRSVWIGISRTDLGSDWQKRWEKWQMNPTLEQITVGTTKPDAGVSSLENGEYVFVLNYGEGQKFGPVTLRRDGVAHQRFKVQK